jgi:hypothetical protein
MKAKNLQTRTSTLLITLLLFLAAGWSNTVRAEEPFNCGSAMVWTDKLDYAPGEVALISGSGWFPGETVEVFITSIHSGGEYWLFATTDQDGNFNNLEFSITEDHFGEEFILIVSGDSSECEAETFFTDGAYRLGAVGLPQNTSVAVNYTITGSGGGNGTFNVGFTTPNFYENSINNKTITVNSYVATYDPPQSIKFLILNYGLRVGNVSQPTTIQTSNAFEVGASNPSNAVLFIANYGALVADNQSVTYGESVNLTATFYSNYQTSTRISGKTITFYLNGTAVGTAVTNASGVATLLLDLTNVQTLGKLAADDYTITTSFAGDAGYLEVAQANSNAATLTVNAKAITGNFTANNKVYDGTTNAVVLNRTLNDVVEGDNVLLVEGTAAFVDKNVGEGKVVTLTGATLSGADAGNYTLTSVGTTTADISQAALTISITAQDKVYDATTAASVAVDQISGILLTDVVTATATNGTFDNKNVGVDKTVTADIATDGADAGNYSFNATATALADISQAALTISITAQDKVYDATTAASVAVDQISGILLTDVVTATATNGTFDNKNVGVDKTVTADIATDGADAGNYSFNATATALADISQAALTISITAQDKVYDATTAASVAVDQISGILLTDVVTATATNGTFDNKNVGVDKTVTADIATDGADAGNYSFNATATALADISQAALTISITAQDKVYDATTAASVAVDQISGILLTDVVTATATNGTFDNKNVGVDKTVTADIATDGADAGNYSFNATATALADISQAALTISITAQDKVYDATTAASVAVDQISGILLTDVVTATATNGTFDNKNVGVDKTVTADIATDGADAGNYSFNATATALADISQAALTISITAQDKVYDATTAASVAVDQISGILLTDVVTATATNGTFDNKNVGVDKTVTADIATDGADAGNYSFNATATALADISQAALTISITAQDKVYDATTAASVAVDQISGILLTDVVTATATNGTFDNKNVGVDKTVTADIATDGADAGNYSFNATATALADISQAALTISITAQDKVYDATTAASVAVDQISGILLTDVVTATATNGTFDNKNVGVDKTVTADIATDGADAGNYSFNATATALADISQAALTISITAQDKVYDATTAASVAVDQISGILLTDVVTATATNGTFDNKNVGVDKTVTADIATDGADAGNYSFNATATALADISQAALTISITAQDKVYDATTAASVAVDQISGILLTDVVTATATNGTFDNKNVGVDKTVTADIATDGADAGNYSFNATATALADISQAALTISITAQDKVYDATTAASVAVDQISGILLTDVVTATATNGTFDNKNVGVDKTVTADIATDGADAGNYSFNATATALADISQAALTISITAQDKVYDATTAASVAVDQISGILLTDVVTATATNGTFDNKNVGVDKTVTADIATDGADAGNYSFNATATALADISQAALTISITAQDKVYDATTAASVAVDQISGILLTDVVTATATNGTFDNKNVGVDKTVTADIATDGADAGNYSFNATASNTADITPRDLTLNNFVADDKTYDGNTSVTGDGFDDDRVAEDQLTFSYDVAFEDKNVGEDKDVNFTNIAISGGVDAGNYTLVTLTGVANAKITVRDLTLSNFVADDKVYDGTTAVTGDGFADDRVSGDDLEFTYDVEFVDKNVGEDKDVNFTNIAISGGADKDNYNLVTTSGTATADITPRLVDIEYLGTRLGVIFGGGVTFDLRALIIDEGFQGDLTGAPVTFTISDGVNQDVNVTVDIQNGDLIYNGEAAIVSETIQYLANLDRTLTITVVIGGNFMGSTTVAGAVYIPKGDHVTGGGFIIPNENSFGPYASDNGSHANFGFNMKYQKKGQIWELNGEMNLVIRSGNQTYQFKSTEALSLGINNAGDHPTAQMTFRGNLNQGNNTLLSGLILYTTMKDRGNPGINNDSIAFTIWNGNTLIYSSNWIANNTERKNLAGGNIVIHKGGTSDQEVELENPEITENPNDGISIEMPVDIDFRVFPNPFRDRLNFRFAPTLKTARCAWSCST